MIYLENYHIDIDGIDSVSDCILGLFFKDEPKFDSMISMINYYNSTGLILNAYELMAIKKYMDDYSSLNGHQTFHVSLKPLIVTRQTKTLNVTPLLSQLFMRDCESTLSHKALYDHYSKSAITPKSKIAFTKDLKRWHPTIKRTQLMVDGKATAAWVGINIINQSEQEV